jgi:DNA-binding GntR family transcriptional regulator
MLERTSLREAIRRQLRTRIIRGQLPGGTRLVEAELAKGMGISRTPLREALIALERDGFLTSTTSRGFTVRSLSSEELREIYPISAVLAAFALTLCPPLSERKRLEMELVNRQLRDCMDIQDDAERAEVRVQLNARWHQLLVSECPNNKLRDMVAALSDQLLRYEYAYCMSGASPLISFEDHHAILDAVMRGESEVAAALLRSHWNAAVEGLASWVDRVTAESEEGPRPRTTRAG